MARWTSSYEFPGKDMECTEYCLQVGNDIWMTHSFIPVLTSDITFVIFKTKTREFMVINHPIPVDFPRYVKSLCSQNEQIYFWGAIGGSDMVLHRLDTKTLQWEYIVTCVSNDIKSCVIVQNFMYLLIVRYDSNTYHMETIDLETKRVFSSQSNGQYETGVILKLTSHQDRVYLVRIEHKTNIRTVYVFENGIFGVIHYDLSGNNEEARRSGIAGFSNGMFNQWTSDNDSMVKLGKFNFSKKEWEQAEVEKCWVDEHDSERWCEFHKINGIVYNIIEKDMEGEIRLLEVTPSLSTVCLLNIMDYYFANNKMEEIGECEKIIPLILRDEWKSMIDWRLVELKTKEKEDLLNLFRSAAKKELEDMMLDGLIDKDEQGYLSYHLKITRTFYID